MNELNEDILYKKLNRILKLFKIFGDNNSFETFKKYSNENIDDFEKNINRKLPKEFKFFYENIGSGDFKRLSVDRKYKAKPLRFSFISITSGNVGAVVGKGVC